MLVGPGQLIKQGGFSAVLVASQGKGQLGPRGQRVFIGFHMVLAPSPKPGWSQISGERSASLGVVGVFRVAMGRVPLFPRRPDGG